MLADAGVALPVMRFGIPAGVSQVFNFASRYWDNLLFTRFFGTGVAGMRSRG